jgi:kynurenine 3-monooxygenase
MFSSFDFPAILCYNTMRYMASHKHGQHIVISGAGLAGCFLAYLLGKEGYKVTVIESRTDFRRGMTDYGKSFNLTLYYRGIRAIKKADLWDDIKKIITPVKGNVCHIDTSKARFDPYEHTNKQVLYTVHRSALNIILLKKAARLKNVSFVFNTKCVGVDKANRTLLLSNNSSKKVKSLKADIIIGADGVNSVIRSEIQRGQSSQHRQEYSDWGYKEVRVSPKLAKRLSLKLESTHTWPRKNTLLLAFPNPDKSFTLMFNLPLEGEESLASLFSEERITNYITNRFPELLPLLPEITAAFLTRPTGYFVTVYTKPWFYRDFMLILGDAAHGVLPFYGQGMCAAFEDCNELMSLLRKYNNDFARVLPAFQQLRKPNTDVLADLSKENFVRLREDAANPYRVAQDKVRSGLHRLFPGYVQPPLYKLIAHDNMPYGDAYAVFSKQQRWLRLVGVDILAGIIAIPLYLASRIKRG